MIPIEAATLWEVGVLRGGIRSVSDQSVYEVFIETSVLGQPVWVEISDDGASEDEVPVVEVVVIVVGVAEVDIGIACGVAGRGDEAAEGGFVGKGVLLLVCDEDGEGGFKFRQTGLC